MNIFKRADWLALAKDRTAIMLMTALLVACIVLVVMTALRLHYNDVQVPVRYTGYGQTFIYRDQWYVQTSYALFAVLVTFVNGLLAVKLYQVRRLLSIGLLGMTLFVVVVAIIVANSIFNLAPSI